MIGRRYHEKKIAVLDVCERYLRFRGDTKDGVDVNSLKTRIEEVKDGRYVLAVIGEAKAGKSTLINALLGEHILPTGVLQTSSAIVEICKSEKKYVEVHYTNGRSQTECDVPDLAAHLRQIGAVRDEHRSSREYEKGQPPANIPERIILGFPLKYAFDGLRLVDSPGVNAVGGFEDATHEYIREANAVLFVHSLDLAVESAFFRNLVNKVVPKHPRETLFLVLTKSGKNSSDDIDMKVKEARRLYTKEIDQDRILHVDSLLKIVSDEIGIVSDEIGEFDPAASLRERYRRQEQDCRAEKKGDEASTFEAKRRLLTNVLDDIGDNPDHETVRSESRKLSNFDELERLIDKFSSRVPWMQLSGLLDSVKSGYDNQVAKYEQNLDAWEKKRKHPQTFENEISEIQSRLDEYQHSMKNFGEQVTQVFTGKDSSYDKKPEQLRDEHLNQLRTAISLDAAKRELENFYNAIGSLGNDVGAKIKTRFEKELKRLGREFKSKHRLTVPTIDISTIELKTKENAYIKYDVPRSPKGAWEWTQKIFTLGLKNFTEEKERYSDSRHLSNFQNEAGKIIQEISGNFPNLVSSLVDDYKKSFESDLDTLIDSRKKELEEIKKCKAGNEKILESIKRAEQKKKVCETKVTQINDMLNDMLGDIR